MKLPKQTKPVMRNATHIREVTTTGGITPSGSCGCENMCLGFCVQGHCQGLCV